MKTHLKSIALSGIVVVAALVASAQAAAAAPIYADSAVSIDTTPFNSGILTGAPDGGGEFLSDTPDPPASMGSITAGFSGGVIDGAGDDLVIFDCCAGGDDFAPDLSLAGAPPDSDEFADVFVSTDGALFTFIGAYGGAGQVNAFDLNGIFGGIVHYVRILNTGKTNSPDIDAFQGNYAAVAPEPFMVALMGIGLMAIILRYRFYRRR